MAFTILSKRSVRIGGGEGAAILQYGAFRVADGETGGELPLDMTVLDSITFGAADAGAQEGYLRVNETVSDGGQIVIPGTGTITIAMSSAASGAARDFFYQAIGY